MLLSLKLIYNICSIEIATVYLQSQAEKFKNPSGDCWRCMIRTGFFLSILFTRFIIAKEPGRGQTLAVTLLDRVTSVLDNRKPHGSTLIFWGLFFSFFLYFLLVTCFFPSFFSLKKSL